MDKHDLQMTVLAERFANDDLQEGYDGIAHDFETLRIALKRISDGQEMSGTWTHAETVARYQQIASQALKAARCT